MQGTQITVESVFISRFTMNNIAPKLQKCWTHKIAFKILELAFYTPEGHTCKVLPFYDFWFGLSSVALTRSSTFTITKMGNRNLKLVYIRSLKSIRLINKIEKRKEIT